MCDRGPDVEERHESERIEVQAFACPGCWRIGSGSDQCAHYASGSIGWAYFTRVPVLLEARRVALASESREG